MKIGVFFGTNTGNTETVVEQLEEILNNNGFEAEIHDMSSAAVDDFADYDNIIIACPTWNDGELQDDWDAVMPELEEFDFSGKKVGFIGLGDQDGYPDNFLDALGTIWDVVEKQGGTLFGQWSTDGFEFDSSTAVRDGKFIGLGIDQDNQEDLTEERLNQWVAQIKEELGA